MTGATGLRPTPSDASDSPDASGSPEVSGSPEISGLCAEGVSHGFEDTRVLEDVSLTLTRGEILAIIGPSGTGKTTLLRLLALFERPSAGRILLEGTDAWEASRRDRLLARRRLGMVFQQPNLFDASVRRNVEYGRHVRRRWHERLYRWLDRVRTSDLDPAVETALSVVGLADVTGSAATSLSGGEAQRVAFARAMACDPDFLLLDEPTSDLDPRNTAVIEAAIGTARGRGMGVAVATHDMHQAERVADRVAVVIDGRLVEVGPTDRVFGDPNDARVRRFVDGELVY